jgi:hypothetical protein
MSDPLASLVDERSKLLRQISELGDFEPGSISSTTRRCGKLGCHCAQPNDPGHGPHFQLTQKIDGKTVTQNLPSSAAVRKAETEIAQYRKFGALADEVVDVNRKICRLRRRTDGADCPEKNGRSDPSGSSARSRPVTARHLQ